MLPVSQAGWEETFIVRARVSTPDDVGAQEVLDALMDVDGTTLMLATDRGVFSRARVDPGTRVLLRKAPVPERGTLLDEVTRMLDRALALSDYREKKERFARQNPATGIKKGMGVAAFLQK